MPCLWLTTFFPGLPAPITSLLSLSLSHPPFKPEVLAAAPGRAAEATAFALAACSSAGSFLAWSAVAEKGGRGEPISRKPRVPKWKIEKHKVKVVFRLQFHATNIPSTGWDKLFLSFISADTGKVTAKTNKANVRNGSCKWPDPIYEATRLLQDPRTKTYDDKLYKLVVAMGTSRSSILGEVDVNLAEFAEALKPASIALSLRGSDSGTLLHITAQLLTTKTGFREFEQQRETGARSSQQLLNQRSHDPAEVAAASSDMGTDKVNARIKLKETSLGFPLVEDSAGSTEDYENSSHTSDGIFTEKYDPCGAHEISSFRSPGDLPLCPTSQSPTPEKGARWGKQLSSPGSNDWTHGWSPEYYADKDLTAAHDENSRLTTRLEVAESAFSQLKTETTSLEHVTDKLGTETKGLAQQLAVELMSRNQLTTEVSLLRTECSNLKEELEEIKSSKLLQKKSDAEGNTMGKHGNDILAADPVHQLQTEWLQGLLLLESKLQQTRNNALHGLQASDLDFLLADLGALQRVIENLKQGVLPGQMKENHYAEHLVPLPNTAHLSNSGHHDTLKKSSGGRTGTMEEKMCELLQKLEDSKTEKENLLEKMSQMERYYESFIHKLEESQKQTAIELENLRKEHNSCFYTVSVLQAQKQKMHEEMNDQLMRFVEDRTALESQNKELERRAAATETALKRVRFNYSAAVERLQKDLELLSFQEVNISGLDEASLLHELQSKNYAGVMKSLEFFHQQTCNKVLHVQQEKEVVVKMCDALQRRSENAESELYDMKQKYACDLDATKQKLNFSEELVEKLQQELQDMANKLRISIVLEAMLSSEIEASYMRSQVREAVVQLNMLRNDFEKLQLKNNDADELLRVHMSTQAELTDRNSALQAAIHSLEINLCSVVQEKKGLEEIMKGHEEAFTKVSNNSHDAAVDNSEKIFEDQNEVSLRVLLTDLEEQIDNVKSTKDENEILNIILRSKLEEQHTMMSSLLQNQRQELTNLIEENKDLTQKLAEQSLKAEEFKNLSIHLRELKEKAEAGRKEKEGSLHAMQDSLRIAFIKEQYESKVQELKGQVFVNKKYAEEMLLKLQSALDDVETGKKNEIALAKKIEELSMKISEMEVEMQDLSADKRELSNAYDSMMTELECTKLNLDCCNEEKQKIELSFDECNEERNRIRVELDLVKKLLKNMALTDNNTSCNSYGSGTPGATSIGNILGDAKAESASRATPNKIEMDPELQEHEIQSRSLTSNLSRADDAGKLGEDEVSKNLELERLKNENMSHLLPLDVNLIDPSLSGLERTLSQLDMANEHLQSIFPSFKELPGSGNALERVLALELELAEALQAKKKTDILFQSSFLKQHSDEAAVFQSFRDINELIQDTIELKRRQVAVESELKEMQGRYSELSVQFAEVEGERQKLEMNLKNRSPWNS
nr:unnamed protein product [Digitaria exilis]